MITTPNLFDEHRISELKDQILHDGYALQYYEDKIVTLDPDSKEFNNLFSNIIALRKLIAANQEELDNIKRNKRYFISGGDDQH
jgi:hypothetical protein